MSSSSRHCEDCKDEAISSDSKSNDPAEVTDGSSDSKGNPSSAGTSTKSSASEEPDSSGSEGVEGSSASVPGGSSDASVYDADKNTLKDLRDGQVYKTTTIDIPSKNYSEVWMAENLNYRYLGPTLTEDSSSFCYGDESVNCTKYGRLYLWSATMDSAGIIKGNTANGCGYGSKCAPSGTVRGVCPQGWHFPSYDEWEALIVAVDGSITEYTSSNTAGSKLKSVTGWSDSGNGTDTFGFSALPVGYRNYNGNYYSEGYGAPFWSSTGNNSNDAYDMGVYYDFGDAYLDYGDNKNFGLSVRCLKD
jgi:uncharacterized protein (TIGR02145 family)